MAASGSRQFNALLHARPPRIAVGSQYLMRFQDPDKNDFDGAKTYKVTLPPNIPAAKFWSFTVYDNQTRFMLDTPQRYPRAGRAGPSLCRACGPRQTTRQLRTLRVS